MSNQKARRKYLAATYEMTEEMFETLYSMQEGECAICEKFFPKEKLQVDHDHKTGKVRGLLCFHCNLGLGHFKDNIRALANAIRYLFKK